MYKPAYFYLSFLNVGAGLAVSLLIIKFFGASGEADSYFMGLAIVSAMQLLQLMMVDQFIYFYQERRAVNSTTARKFASTVLLQCFCVSLVVALLLWWARDLLLVVFAFGFDSVRRGLTVDVLGILLWTCLFFPPNFVVHRLLNAESLYSITYLFELLTPLLTLILFVYFWLDGDVDIKLLAYSRLVSLGLSFMLGVITVWRLGYLQRCSFFSQLAVDCYRNSFSMRLGHNLHNFLFSPITNTILSFLPQGSVAIYYYADRLAQVFSAVVVGPFQRVFQVEAGELWRQGDYSTIRAMQKSFMLRVIALYALATTSAYLALPYLLAFIGSDFFDAEQVGVLQLVFVMLATWIGVIAVEFAYVAIGLAARKSGLFLKVNILFIASYGLMCLLLSQDLGIYAIPLAAVCAQALSFLIFAIYIRSLLAGGEHE